MERTCTTSVSRYGCGIDLPRRVRFNEELRIRRLDSGDWEVGRVVSDTKVQSDRHLYGVEMVKLCDEFWGIRFSSRDERLQEALRDGMYFVDRERKITHWSEGAESVSGHAAADIVGTFCYNNILGHVDGKGTSLCAKGCPLVSVMVDGKPREVQMNMRHKDGHPVAVSVRAQAIFNSAGRIVGAVEMFHTHPADGPEAAAVQVSPPCARPPMDRVLTQIETPAVIEMPAVPNPSPLTEPSRRFPLRSPGLSRIS